jgi:ABC-2 type transport system ATP-binding protein
VLKQIGFVAQNRPLYPSFTVHDMLKLGEKLNTSWDAGLARTRLESLKIPLSRRTVQLSGGQQAQVALVLALAKRPELLILDEPVGSLDPLARREFLQLLTDSVAKTGHTVLLSSHQVADLDRICDYLIILSSGRIQVAENIETLMATHRWMAGPHDQAEVVAREGLVLQANYANEVSTLLVRMKTLLVHPGWDVRAASLEDIILGYLAYPSHALQFEEGVAS